MVILPVDRYERLQDSRMYERIRITTQFGSMMVVDDRFGWYGKRDSGTLSRDMMDD